VPNLRLRTILLWMTDLLEIIGVLKSSDRLKQEIKHTKVIDFCRVLFTFV